MFKPIPRRAAGLIPIVFALLAAGRLDADGLVVTNSGGTPTAQ